MAVQIIPLSEGSFTIDKTKQFVPFDENSDELNDRPTGSLLVEVQPFIVITDKDVLLLDTGLGFQKNEDWQLVENIKQAGVDPASITKVLLSHLHKDHAGAIGRNGQILFPNATYYVQQAELDFAFEKGSPSYLTDEFDMLRESSNVIFLDGDGIIDNYIEYKISGGHSPHHQVFWIRTNDEIIFFGADEAPQLQQMKHRFVAKYDFDGKKAMELRQQWWQQGKEEGWIFLFYHDIATPTFKPVGS